MYNIAVKIDGFESRRRSAGFLHIMMGFFLIAKGADYYRLIQYKTFLPLVPILLVASFSLFYGLFRKRVDPSAHYNYWLRLIQVLTFTVLGVLMANVGRTIDYISVFTFVLLCIILMFSERRIFMDTIISIDEAGIRIPGYYRDHLIKWDSLSNVIVREDFITIFHIRQKYLQYQVLQDLSTLEVAKMNAFCKEQIERVAETSITNN